MTNIVRIETARRDRGPPTLLTFRTFADLHRGARRAILQVHEKQVIARAARKQLTPGMSYMYHHSTPTCSVVGLILRDVRSAVDRMLRTGAPTLGNLIRSMEIFEIEACTSTCQQRQVSERYPTVLPWVEVFEHAVIPRSIVDQIQEIR